MKKVLLTLATVLVTLCSNAQEVGDYFFTSTGRYKVTDVLDVVQPGEDWNNYSAEIFSPYKAETEDDVDGIESLKSDEGDFISYAFPIEHGAQYVITFSFMGTADKSSSNADGALNQIDAWASPQDDQGTRAGTTNIDYMQVASTFTIKANEWVDVSWTFIDTLAANAEAEGGYLNILFSRIESEYIIATNLKIIKVEQVYDTRIAQRKIDFVKKLMEDPNFDTEEAAELKEELAGTIEGVQEMMDGNDESFDSEDGAFYIISSLDESIENFLSVTSQSMNGQLANIDITSIGAYGRGRITAMLGCLDIIGGNWGHISGSDALRSAIQKNYANEATLKIKNTSFPAGKYFFSAEMRNARTSAAWPCDPLVFTLTTAGTTMWVGDKTITVDDLYGEAYQQFYVIGDVAEDGTFEAGVYWPGVTSGGAAFEIRNLQVRGFGNPLDKVAHAQAWSSFITQWNAAKNARTALIAKADDANYPWANDTIQKTLDQWDPIYNKYLNVWVDEEGNDLGVATNEELEAFGAGTYQGYEYEEGIDSERLAKYALVRAYQDVNSYIVAQNQPIADLSAKIASAIATRDDTMNVKCEKEIINDWIDAAQTLYDDIIANTNDERQEADTENINVQLDSYQDVIDAFIASGELLPIIDIDFSNGFTAITDPEDEETITGYEIQGAAGKMEFPTVANVRPDLSVDGQYWQLGYGNDALDVLHVGSSEAFVTIPEELTDDDILKVSFDLWLGNLSKGFMTVELRNDANERVGGFSIDSYNANVNYNDFNNQTLASTGNATDITASTTSGGDGMNLRGYKRSLGSGSVGNLGIYADDAKNHFDLVVDFKAKTLQGTIISKAGTCTGADMPMLAENNKVTKFVITSNYASANSSAQSRRCWFDNLIMYKYASIAEDVSNVYYIGVKRSELKALITQYSAEAYKDIEDAVAAADAVCKTSTATLEELEAAIEALQGTATGVVTVSSAKVNTPAAIYTLSGSKVNALQKGINIVKYADGQVKKVLVK